MYQGPAKNKRQPTEEYRTVPRPKGKIVSGFLGAAVFPTGLVAITLTTV